MSSSAIASITYDHREERSGIPGLLLMEDLELEAAQLPVGDYLVSERLLIERKSIADLYASLKDGRLFDQMGRMREVYSRPVLLVEGGAPPSGVEPSLIRRGVFVLRSTDERSSADLIATLARQEARPSRSRRPLGRKRGTRLRDEIIEDSVASLPGVSVQKAKLLLGEFRTIKRLSAASSTELQRVSGIGKKTADRLEELFKHHHGS